MAPPATDGQRSERLERFARQCCAARLLPKERVGQCLTRIRPDREQVDIWRSVSCGATFYGGLLVCGSVWQCPVCAVKVSEKRREELRLAIDKHRADGGQVFLAAYTFRHGVQAALGKNLARFLAAFRSMTGSRGYRKLLLAAGVVGTIRALEIMYGLVDGWHPHAHQLIFLPGGVDVIGFRSALFREWQAAARRHGLTMSPRGLSIRATEGAVGDYVAKWGQEPKSGRAWGAEDELAKQTTKRGKLSGDGDAHYTPFGLLGWYMASGETWAAARYQEYCAALKGKRQLVWSRGLRALLLPAEQVVEKSDEELAEEQTEEAVHVVSISPAEWRLILAHGARGVILEEARKSAEHVKHLLWEMYRADHGDALAGYEPVVPEVVNEVEDFSGDWSGRVREGGLVLSEYCVGSVAVLSSASTVYEEWMRQRDAYFDEVGDRIVREKQERLRAGYRLRARAG